jgi:hypothetical protein
VAAFFNRALVTLQQGMATGTRDASDPAADHGVQAGAALVALLRVLLPEGERR